MTIILGERTLLIKGSGENELYIAARFVEVMRRHTNQLDQINLVEIEGFNLIQEAALRDKIGVDRLIRQELKLSMENLGDQFATT